MYFKPFTPGNASALEDAMLRGDWTLAQNGSHSLLTAWVEQLEHDEKTGPSSPLTMEMKRVLSVYLQSIFELDLDHEVETAIIIIKAFSPLPSDLVLPWSRFLIAMNRRSLATQYLQNLLVSDTLDKAVDWTPEESTKAAEILVVHLLLPDEGIEAARTFVTENRVLKESTKLHLLRQIQAAHSAIQEERKNSQATAADTAASSNDTSQRRIKKPSQSSGSTGLTEVQQQEEKWSTFIKMGGTAIGLAVVATGALRYRNKIHEAVRNAIPVISKGLADAKFALFGT